MTIEAYTDEQIASLLVHPAADANKYTRGKLVVVAGSGAYPGAACLASHAAQRMGAGYVEVVCAPESADVVRASRASMVVRPWDDWRFAEQAELTQQHAEYADEWAKQEDDDDQAQQHVEDVADQAQQYAADVADQAQQRAEDYVEQIQQSADQAKSEEQHAGDTADDQVQQRAEDQEVASSQHFATYAAKHPAACVIGPGFDAHGKTEQKLVLAALREVAAPLLVDGGAISVLATSEGMAAAHERAERGWPLIVTPHGGEAARMEYAARIGAGANAAHGEQSTRDDVDGAIDRAQSTRDDANVSDCVQAPAPAGTAAPDRVQAPAPADIAPADTPAADRAQAPAPADRAQTLATAYRCVVALKGSNTYLSDGKRTVAMLQGTAALAKAGTGDVLAGMIGALLAQNVDPLDACVAGTTIHAKAGRDAADHLGDISVTAEDVIDAIPSVIYDLSFPNRIL